ncbi:MAG: deoxyribonuclease IV [Oligoflexia bacterium]|nr:deoxyribonuclease IV [Oligoflexia bacterium]
MKKFVGAHVSATGGVESAPINANSIGAKAFAFFLKNQRQWNAKDYTDENISEFKKNCELYKYNSKHILPHSSYLINLGSPKKDSRLKSIDAFTDELIRCEQLGLIFLNVHPGSHLKELTTDECAKLISDSINSALEKSETKNVSVVLENTAGQGSWIGSKFEELQMVIDGIDNKFKDSRGDLRIGVCLDTCHMFAAGYDISSKDGFLKVMTHFNEVVGFKFLKGMHINDSKSDLGQRLDRHHSINQGKLGSELFRLIMNDSRFDDIPLILETIDDIIWAEEIKLLYSLID